MTTLAQKIAEPQFSGLTDNAVADLLNAADPSLPLERVDVATADAKEILLSTGEWAKVVLAADNASTPESIRGACIVLRDTIMETSTVRAPVAEIYNATAALLGGLVTAGVLTSGTRNSIMALADVPQSWAKANGIEVSARTVGLARGAN